MAQTNSSLMWLEQHFKAFTTYEILQQFVAEKARQKTIEENF